MCASQADGCRFDAGRGSLFANLDLSKGPHLGFFGTVQLFSMFHQFGYFWFSLREVIFEAVGRPLDIFHHSESDENFPKATLSITMSLRTF